MLPQPLLLAAVDLQSYTPDCRLLLLLLLLFLLKTHLSLLLLLLTFCPQSLQQLRQLQQPPMPRLGMLQLLLALQLTVQHACLPSLLSLPQYLVTSSPAGLAAHCPASVP
jgi:hypothetical protein